jgi:hypothetical protein
VDNDNPGVEIIHRGKYKTLTNQQRRWLKRRQAIEPMIGHTKSDNRMDRCWLKGALGDALHAHELCGGLQHPLVDAGHRPSGRHAWRLSLAAKTEFRRLSWLRIGLYGRISCGSPAETGSPDRSSTSTRWKAPPLHGARHELTLATGRSGDGPAVCNKHAIGRPRYTSGRQRSHAALENLTVQQLPLRRTALRTTAYFRLPQPVLCEEISSISQDHLFLLALNRTRGFSTSQEATI